MRQRLTGCVALAHIDLASGDRPSSERLFAGLPPLLAPLMRRGGMIVSERELPDTAWIEMDLPDRVPRGRYRIYGCASEDPQ
jgi:hypothetical protein